MKEEVEGVGIENDAILRHGVEDGWNVREEANVKEAEIGEGAKNEGVHNHGMVVVGVRLFEKTKLLHWIERIYDCGYKGCRRFKVKCVNPLHVYPLTFFNVYSRVTDIDKFY